MWWLVACGGTELKYLEAPKGKDDVPLPLVVALHGYGDVPESELDLVATCGLDVRIVAPRGPLPHPAREGGAGWYLFTPEGRDDRAIFRAVDGVARFVRRYVAEHATTKVIATGFSQGGILSFGLATRYPDLVDTVIPISGGVPEVVPAKPGAPVIRALHGAEDERLPAKDTAKGVRALAAAGWDASIEVFPDVAHQVPEEVHDALCRELRAALGR